MKRFLAFICMAILLISMLPACVSTADGFTVEPVQPTDAERVIRGYSTSSKSYVYMNFGSYPFNANGSKEPCLWRVLHVEDGFAFLLEEWVVDFFRFHPVKKDQDAWKDYEIYTTMNTTMVDKMFTAEEKRAVRYTADLGWLFILDNNEFMTPEYGFKKILTKPYAERKCPPTPYAKSLGVGYIDKNKMTWYWSRSCRHTAAGGYEHIIGYDGHISMHAFDQVGGVRPACYVDLTQLDHVTGSGTLKDPYVFQVVNP